MFEERIITKDQLLRIPETEIRFESYFPAVVRLWPGDAPTPPPETSSRSSSDSGLDTVN